MSFSAYNTEELTEYLPEALFLEDFEGNILDVNTEACQLLGYEKEELLSLAVEDLVPEGAPAFLPDRIDEATRSGVPLETINVKKDGTEVPVELRGRILEVEGKERLLVSIRDIAERKSQEKRIRSLARDWQETFDALKDSLFLVDEDHTIEKVNQSFLDLLDASKEEIEGRKCYEIVHDKQEPIDECPLEESLKSQETEVMEVYEPTVDKYLRLKVQPREGGKRDRTSFVHQIIDITERKEMEKAHRRERDQLRELHDAVDRFQACQNEDELYETTLEMTKTIMEFDISLIYLVRDDKLVPEGATNLGRDQLQEYDKDEALAGKTLTKGETIWGRDVRNLEVARPEDPQIRSYMSVPIGNLGVFQAASKTKSAFTEVDVELAEVLAGHLNEEIQRIRLEEELREQAIRDPLTSLYNRRYFNETLQKEVEQCKRYDRSISFLMLDVDRFKEVNDRYSHQTGDEVLKEVATLLKENVRDADTVVRYGGDEFLVMMPEKPDGSAHVIKRLEEALNRWNEESNPVDFPLSLAKGFSHWRPDQDRDIEEALKEADRKMYEDKGK